MSGGFGGGAAASPTKVLRNPDARTLFIRINPGHARAR